jgi:methylmalonyl-CoA mutase
VNRFRLEKEDPLDILEVDNTAVRESQLARLAKLKAERDNAAVDHALAGITQLSESGTGNLLAAAVDAARLGATVGEISLAMEKVFGRYSPRIQTISGVYIGEASRMEKAQETLAKTAEFYELEGRRPRMLVAKIGQDGHDRGAKVIATAFADLGFDVDIGPLFATPGEVARQAIENDVHFVGVSSLAGGHKTLIPQLIEELGTMGRPDIHVVCGGVIPAQDYPALEAAGCVAIFGPGTVIPEAALKLVELLIRERG